ncbi:MAG: ATP-binding cassette domain-containing protein [Bacteroidia bacterium]|nr:ATP-binding cassette domain-containing protein [Bacteroidia bacterium]HQU99629.1 ATP-binding cassette domain-containing protein [Bacteroidia bacterium]
MLEIKNLIKKYGNQIVLNNLNLKSDKQVIGLIGDNGSGKTTLFKCIAGIETYQGEISQKQSSNYKTGLLLTEPFFMPYLTGYEYLTLLCKARNINPPDFSKSNIFNLPLNQYAANYSTGMKKKLALTGVLIQQNETFIFDEPYNGVDHQGCQLIMAVIEKLKAKGHTILISSHIIDTLTPICDTLFVIKQGTISEEIQHHNFNAFISNLKLQAQKNIDVLWE